MLHCCKNNWILYNFWCILSRSNSFSRKQNTELPIDAVAENVVMNFDFNIRFLLSHWWHALWHVNFAFHRKFYVSRPHYLWTRYGLHKSVYLFTLNDSWIARMTSRCAAMITPVTVIIITSHYLKLLLIR